MEKNRIATFAAGCFWGVEEKFRTTPGVLGTMVGYTGGHTQSPTYEHVCSGTTGHAEAVQLIYDPHVVRYEELLSLFWRMHDPTTMNRQGPDIGSQYRSVIFYHNEEQQLLAEASKSRFENEHTYQSLIVTEIIPATTFYKAEEYHQQYILKTGRNVCS